MYLFENYSRIEQGFLNSALLAAAFAQDNNVPYSKIIREKTLFNFTEFNRVQNKVNHSPYSVPLRLVTKDELVLYSCLHLYCYLLASKYFKSYIEAKYGEQGISGKEEHQYIKDNLDEYAVIKEIIMKPFEQKLAKEQDFIVIKNLLNMQFKLKKNIK